MSIVEEHWRRIAGLHVSDAGDLAVVWLAHDKTADVLHLFDCAIFRDQPPAVIAEGINARGRSTPIAWEKKAEPTRDMLFERGVNVIDPLKEDDAVAEVWSREIWERMRTGRFKVASRLKEWLDEYKTFYRTDTAVPRDSHPLMAATRYAVAQLPWAQPVRRKTSGKKQVNYPKLAII